jgi:hypothetical protein
MLKPFYRGGITKPLYKASDKIILKSKSLDDTSSTQLCIKSNENKTDLIKKGKLYLFWAL